MPIATPPSESIDVLVMLALLVVGPLIGAVLSTCVATGSRRWVSAAALLLVLAMSAGLQWQLQLAESDATSLHWGPIGGVTIAWTYSSQGFPLLVALVLVTWVSVQRGLSLGSSAWTIPCSLGLMGLVNLVVVAQDVTSLLTGWAGAIVSCWWLMSQRGDAVHRRHADWFLREQLAGWICLLVGFAALIGGLSLVRSAPHSAPSATGFLLAADLLQLPRVCGQHPAALQIWEQWRGWALIPFLAASLTLGGCLPRRAWPFSGRSPANAVAELWWVCVLTKLPLLLIGQIIAPVFIASPELLLLWLGGPLMLGMWHVASSFWSRPVSADQLRTAPLLWGNHVGLWLVVHSAAGPRLDVVAPLLLVLLSSLMWSSSVGTTAAAPSSMRRRLGTWCAGLMLSLVPVLAWQHSLYDLGTHWMQTQSPLDSLMWLGFVTAVLLFATRLLPAITRSMDGVLGEPEDLQQHVASVELEGET
ncbi:MAG: hypothetical protein KDA58_01835 [Planctomycetaceae bacterium]|nr:hypothetical protein [Planctomycetaceae bacterium]